MYRYFLSYKSTRYKGGVVILAGNFERIMREQVGNPVTEMNEKLDKLNKTLSPPKPKKKPLSHYVPLIFYGVFGIAIIFTMYRMGLYTLHIPLP
jgi:hypothetical protein